MTDREAMKMALDALENPHSGWIQREKNARKALHQALAQPEQTAVPFPSFMRKRIEQALKDAIHPTGMSVHDGKVKVLVSDLHRMLLVIDSVLAQPEQAEYDKLTVKFGERAKEYLEAAKKSWEPEQEPVAWRCTAPPCRCFDASYAKNCAYGYTTPSKPAQEPCKCIDQFWCATFDRCKRNE